MELPVLRLLPGRDRRLRSGHPWIYANEIRTEDLKEVAAGSLVRVQNAARKGLGIAYANPHSLIVARMLTRRRDAVIDRNFFIRRIERALALRERLWAEPCYRLVHAEGDGLPGLVVDRFGPHLVVQLNTAGAERLWPLVAEALEEVVRPASVLLRNDSPVRELEGLGREVRVHKGEPPELAEVREEDLTFLADLRSGQKTGWFYDQALNRRLVRLFAREATVLDLFTYSGGFALHALRAGARQAVLVDSSAAALALAERNARLQGMASRVEMREADAFAALEALRSEGRSFDLVIADPPSFVRSKNQLARGLRSYRRLAEACARLTAAGGVLAVACCSHNVPLELFLRELGLGIKAATRGARRLLVSGQSPDHPVHPMLAETAYLKFVAFALD